MKSLILTPIIALALLILISCDLPQPGKVYKTLSKDTRTTTTIEVRWVTVQKIDDVCKALGADSGNTYRGCARSKPGNTSICEIYAVRPNDFDDRDTLYHFGHETWHCLGATHD